jgi:cysteine desulfurase
MGISEELSRGSLRVTLGKDNTPAEIDRFLDVLPGVIARLRELSPLWRAEAGAGAGGPRRGPLAH